MGPIRTAFVTLVVVLVCTVLWVGGDIYAAIGLPPWLVRSLIPFLIGYLLWQLIKGIQKRLALEGLSRPTGVHGWGRLATLADLIKAKLAGEISPDSFIFGALGRKLLHYPGFSHICVIAPNNAGKSESLGAVNALHIGHNLFVTDKAGELAKLTYVHRQDRLRQRVIVINPWGVKGLPNHHFNPLDEVVGKIARKERDAIDVARALALITIPEPEKSGDNAFFLEAARDLTIWLIMALAYWQVDTGERVCNFPYLYRVLCGSQADLEEWLSRMRAMPDGNGALAQAADRHTSRLQRAAKTFENILAVAQNALATYDPISPLGQSMERSDFALEDFKTTAMTIYLVIPPDKQRAYAAWTGIVTDIAIRIAMSQVEGGRRVTFLLDEFANLSPGPLPSVMPALFLGRGLGCRLVYMVQDRRSFERYGAEASAFITQAEVTLTWGVRNPDDAEWVEKRSGQRGIVTESTGVPGSKQKVEDEFSLNLSERPIPIISRHDALSLPRFTAVAFFADAPPAVVDLVSWRSIDPLKDFAKKTDTMADLPTRFQL